MADPPRDGCLCRVLPHLGPFCARCGNCYHHCADPLFTFREADDARPERVIWMTNRHKPIWVPDAGQPPLRAKKKTAG